jgi:outer membrane protein TolC
MRSDVIENAQGLRAQIDPQLAKLTYKALGNLREDLLRLTRNLMVIQLSLRIELIDLPSFEMAMETAVQVALENRVDLMNERALVMDARRKVEIAANSLLAGLDVVIDGDINTPTGNRPFDFRGSQSQIRAGVAFTAPLDQIDERNFYRTSLINYQRQRRNFMQIEDQVKQEVRNAWRQLFTLRQNMETSRRATRIAALQYDSAVELSNAPVTPGASTKGNGVSGNNLQTALQTLLNSQNSLISTWVSYEVNRLNIYRDMGIMEIGPDGLWADPFYQDQVNDVEHDALGPSLNLGDPPAADGAGRLRLGAGTVDGDLDSAHGSGLIQVRAEKSGAGDRATRPVSGEPERAGLSRQP